MIKLKTLVLVGAFPTLLAAQGINLSFPGIPSSHQIGNEQRPNGLQGGGVGQAFQFSRPGPLRLDSWSFWMQGFTNSQVRHQLQIFEISGDDLFSQLLYTSPVVTPPTTMEKVTFAPGIMLDPDVMYLFLMNPVDLVCGACFHVTLFQQMAAGPQAAAGAQGVFHDGGAWLLRSTIGPDLVWRDITDEPVVSRGMPLRYEVVMSEVNVVPEPTTLTLLATGVAGLAGLARRRRHKAR